MAKNRKKPLKLPFLDLSDSTKRTKWLLRVFSVAFAVILWLFVTWDGSTLGTRTITVPLRYLGMSEGYTISNTTSEISVRFEGRAELLPLISRTVFSASVNLSGMNPGKYTLPVELSVPEGVRVLSFTPKIVEFELYRMIERRLRPLLVLTDELPRNLTLEEVRTFPLEVRIKGPEESVMAVKRAELRDTVAGLRADRTKMLPIVLMGDEGQIEDLSVDPEEVRVSARFAEATEEVSVPVTISVTGIPAGGLSVGTVTVSPDVVVLRGTRDALSHISSLALNPIDVTGHTENVEIDVPLSAPGPGINVVGETYAKVRIELHSATERRTFLGVPIRVRGEGGFAEWELSPATASVTVERTIATSEPFDLRNPPLELYIDVTNIVSRKLVLPILPENVKDGMKVLRIEPQQVAVSAVEP